MKSIACWLWINFLLWGPTAVYTQEGTEPSPECIVVVVAKPEERSTAEQIIATSHLGENQDSLKRLCKALGYRTEERGLILFCFSKGLLQTSAAYKYELLKCVITNPNNPICQAQVKTLFLNMLKAYDYDKEVCSSTLRQILSDATIELSLSARVLCEVETSALRGVPVLDLQEITMTPQQLKAVTERVNATKHDILDEIKQTPMPSPTSKASELLILCNLKEMEQCVNFSHDALRALNQLHQQIEKHLADMVEAFSLLGEANGLPVGPQRYEQLPPHIQSSIREAYDSTEFESTLSGVDEQKPSEKQFVNARFHIQIVPVIQATLKTPNCSLTLKAQVRAGAIPPSLEILVAPDEL
ncbi:MAG: hypothetical protein KatS3mg020_0851 [Fimbriimonadales bacterium]|nr:MAG: hypothetical protein KatS3mg020_0851 [Fimbriimonadales bacterium]